ncbi:NAD-dependent epimerase/dehydratase family protein [Amycolatopsis pithecellobii]|uniref:NAD-dependent epimerase/dehydratase family protein n=1 Tax=Amycolatopsis pithecellobii TaxID=664692 RepID=A0A6N7Z2E2_9PSEU|nr:NAD-dependent epimerase/dehydratase family protein [Amycolatopsis pithecellobii]MTD55803.1 NAD-dependent epimerase/dehydratase family protein [Amycolatopsis pithecellobii]
MKILVFGATGYAGSHLAPALARAGHTVLGLTRNPDSPAARQLTIGEVTPVQGNFSDPDTWRAHLDGVDAVVHSMMDPAEPYEGDRRLFAEVVAAQERDGRKRHVVFTTGISCYGRTGVALMDENTPGNPESFLSFRFQLEKELAASGLSHTIVRPGFMYGGAGTTSMSAQWFAAAEEGKPVFYGDPEKQWSWVHIDDLAEAYVRILAHPAAVDGETFVIADDQRLRVLDVMKVAIGVAGYTGEITMESAEAGGVLQVTADQNELVSSAKARRILGWTPNHASFTDAPEVHYRAWKAARPA